MEDEAKKNCMFHYASEVEYKSFKRQLIVEHLLKAEREWLMSTTDLGYRAGDNSPLQVPPVTTEQMVKLIKLIMRFWRKTGHPTHISHTPANGDYYTIYVADQDNPTGIIFHTSGRVRYLIRAFILLCARPELLPKKEDNLHAVLPLIEHLNNKISHMYEEELRNASK